GQHQARQVHLAAADVGVQVDAAGHHHAAGEVVFGVDLVLRVQGDDAAVADADVAELAVDAVGGVVDAPALEPDRRHCAPSFAAAPLVRRATSARATSATVGRPSSRTAWSGSDTTLSARSRWPSALMPGVATGMNTVPGCAHAFANAGWPSTMRGSAVCSGGRSGVKLATHSSRSTARSS